MIVVTVEQMRAIEKNAELVYGLTGEKLMQTAGDSAARIAADWFGKPLRQSRWLFLIGPGNNGGDGKVMAGRIQEWGAEISLFHLKTMTLESSAGIKALAEDLQALTVEMQSCDVVVDALLGIGHSRPLSGTLLDVCRLVQQTRAAHQHAPLCVAIDNPTGVHCDTGATDEGAITADVTITLAFPKTGLLFFPAFPYVGELHTGSIGLPVEMPITGTAELLDYTAAAKLLPQRNLNSYKGAFGKALIIAGSNQFPGAALIAASAAARCGAGLIQIATTPERAAVYTAALPEAVYCLSSDEAIPRANSAAAAAVSCSAILIGPGLGQDIATKQFLLDFLRRVKEMPDGQRPKLVIDADGLNLLSAEKDWPKCIPANTVLTPHPGEMKRLIGGSAEISNGEMDRLQTAKDYAQQWGHIVVLKGAITIIATPQADTLPAIFAKPNSAIAVAGSGDALAGIITGLLAQGLGEFEAAKAGVALHSVAGFHAAQAIDALDSGLLITDLVRSIPAARKRIMTVL